MKKTCILLLVLILIVNALPQYNNPIVIDMPVQNFILNPLDNNILIASAGNIYCMDLKGTIINTIPSNSTTIVSNVAVNTQTGMVAAIYNDSVIRVYENNLLFSTINVSELYNKVLFDNFHNAIISIKYEWNEYAQTYFSNVHYFDINGKKITNYTIDFFVWNVIMNPTNGDIICDSFLVLEPAVYMAVSNINGIITKINTTREYAGGGMCLNNQDNIITAEYGLDIYDYNGTFIKHLNSSNGYSVFSPQVYQSYIAYIDLFSDNYKPFIQFIDYDGNKLLKIDCGPHGTSPNGHSYFKFDKKGNIIASLGNQIKIWINTNS